MRAVILVPFHADDLGKIGQVRDGPRNFNHPLLLLGSASALAALRGAGGNLHEIAISERLASLAFAALTAGLLTLWARLLRGPRTAWAAAVAFAIVVPGVKKVIRHGGVSSGWTTTGRR